MKQIAMALIRFYRKYLSGLKPAPTCRFTPTCSAYGLEAYEKRGFFAGTVLPLWRILQCLLLRYSCARYLRRLSILLQYRHM